VLAQSCVLVLADSMHACAAGFGYAVGYPCLWDRIFAGYLCCIMAAVLLGSLVWCVPYCQCALFWGHTWGTLPPCHACRCVFKTCAHIFHDKPYHVHPTSMCLRHER
jgi:hypothetical protein